MRYLWVLPVIVLMGGCQPQQAARQEITEMGIAEINQLLQSSVEDGDIPGVVAIVANKDRILYHQSFGKMDVQNNRKMKKESIFSIASMTKPVTSVAVMMLYEEGKLDLDDLQHGIPQVHLLHDGAVPRRLHTERDRAREQTGENEKSVAAALDLRIAPHQGDGRSPYRGAVHSAPPEIDS